MLTSNPLERTLKIMGVSVMRYRVLNRNVLGTTLLMIFAGCSGGHDELDHKGDYSFLQSTARTWQSASPELGNLLVRDVESDRCVAGIYRADSSRVWILLNHESDVLRLPDQEISLTPGDLQEILEFCEPSEVVREFLERASDGA